LAGGKKTREDFGKTDILIKKEGDPVFGCVIIQRRKRDETTWKLTGRRGI